MYGHIATATGWTLTQIDQLSLSDVDNLFAYWRDHPPTHVLLGAYFLSGKRGSKRRGSQPRVGLYELKEAVALAGGGMGKVLPEAYRRG